MRRTKAAGSAAGVPLAVAGGERGRVHAAQVLELRVQPCRLQSRESSLARLRACLQQLARGGFRLGACLGLLDRRLEHGHPALRHLGALVGFV